MKKSQSCSRCKLLNLVCTPSQLKEGPCHYCHSQHLYCRQNKKIEGPGTESIYKRIAKWPKLPCTIWKSPPVETSYPERIEGEEIWKSPFSSIPIETELDKNRFELPNEQLLSSISQLASVYYKSEEIPLFHSIDGSGLLAVAIVYQELQRASKQLTWDQVQKAPQKKDLSED